MATTSKTIVLTGYGGKDNLKIEYRDKPKPNKGQVVVHIKAAGVNFAQLMYKQGLSSGTKSELPVVLGVEGAGNVCEVGDGVDTFKCGDRVMCVSTSGLWTEFAAVDTVKCFHIPDSMTFEEAAAIPVNYITAYHMLFDMGNLRQGKSVLIHMAAGGAGLAATQLTKSVPNTTVFGTCSAAKHEMVKKFGVDHPIDYRTQDYVEEVKKVSPKGVDIVLDPLSGPDSAKGFNLLKPLGHIIHFGAANMVSGSNRSWWQMFKTYMGTKAYNPLWLLPSNKGFHGYHLGHLWDSTDIIDEAVAALLDLYQHGLIKPPIDSVWPFEDVEQAMDRMQSRKNIGKMILTPQMKSGTSDIRIP